MRLSRLRSFLWPVLGLFGAAPPIAAYPIPDEYRSTVPDLLTVVGRDGGGAPDTGYPFTVVLRDHNGLPVTNWQVILDFSATGLRICADQGPLVTVDCSHRLVYAFVDMNGSVTFHIVGCAANTGGSPGPSGPTLAVFADYKPLSSVRVAVLDQNGCDGVDANDFSLWLADFFSGRTFARSDYDGDGSLGGNDLSLWLAAFFTGASGTGCHTAVCP